MINFTDHEIFIAKVVLIQGAVLFGKQSSRRALELLYQHAKQHGFTKEYAVELAAALNQMFGDDLLR